MCSKIWVQKILRNIHYETRKKKVVRVVWL